MILLFFKAGLFYVKISQNTIDEDAYFEITRINVDEMSLDPLIPNPCILNIKKLR
ncbi:MAG: hypothetical protein ACJA0H_002135 [Francisellaceae bacterium]|jgi:hypothetical protein